MTTYIEEMENTVLDIMNNKTPSKLYYRLDQWHHRKGFAVEYRIGWFKKIIVTFDARYHYSFNKVTDITDFRIELCHMFKDSYAYGSNSFLNHTEIKAQGLKLARMMTEADAAAKLEAENTEKHNVIKFLKNTKS